MGKEDLNVQCLCTIDCNQGAVRSVRFNVDGSYCLTCGSDRKIKLWNPYRQLVLKTYYGHGNEVLDCAASCDSSRIISCSSDKSVIIWDVSTGQPLRRLRGHASTVTCIAYNEESSVAISGGLDNAVMCWDVNSRRSEPIQVLNDAKDCITSIAISDAEILAGSVDCSVRRYDLRNGSCQVDFVGAPVVSVRFSNDGQCILVSSADNVIRLLDKNTGELLGEYTGHRIDDLTIQSGISNNDATVMSGSVTGELWCWNLVSGSVYQKLLHTPRKVLNFLSVHPKKDIILTASVNTIKLWGPADCIKQDQPDSSIEIID